MQTNLYKRLSARQSGFTLVELMIVVVIVGILAAVGYPGYLEYVTRSNRQAARANIYRLADRQEQFFGDNKAYAADLTALGFGADTISVGRDGQQTDGDDVIYTLSISDGDALSYTIEAVPEGTQAERDTSCATLTLTNTGVRAASGGGDRCW